MPGDVFIKQPGFSGRGCGAARGRCNEKRPPSGRANSPMVGRARRTAEPMHLLWAAEPARRAVEPAHQVAIAPASVVAWCHAESTSGNTNGHILERFAA